MEIYYVNNKNEKINLLSDTIAIQNIESLFGRKWEYVSRNSRTFGGRIKRFYKGVKEKDFVISVVADNEFQFSEIFRRLHDVTEYDVAIKKAGRLYVNDYYLSCYIIGSEYAEFEDLMYMTDLEYTLVSEYPAWVKETPTTFDTADNMGLCLAGFAFAGHATLGVYSTHYYSNIIVNSDFEERNLIIDVCGPTDNPTVFVGDTEYSVMVEVPLGGYLHINTLHSRCVLIHEDGTEENVYGQRDCDNIFAKIKPGTHGVRWNTNKDINIAMLNERGEPSWI